MDTPDRRDPQGMPLRVFYNDEAAISVSRRSDTMPYCFRNADGDELHFIHKGQGLLRSDYGPLRYEEGDYILIPKGTSYQIVPDRSENFSLIIETRGRIRSTSRWLRCVAPAAAVSTGAGRRWTHVSHRRDSSILTRHLRGPRGFMRNS